MIEEIKNEILGMKYRENVFTNFIDELEPKSYNRAIDEVIRRLDKYKYIDNYKNAWEENKSILQEHRMTWCVNMSGAETRKEIDTCEKWKKYWEEKIAELEELEQKHNIGSGNNE